MGTGFGGVGAVGATGAVGTGGGGGGGGGGGAVFPFDTLISGFVEGVFCEVV